MLIASTGFSQHGISSRKLWSYSTSPILSKATNSYSIKDLTSNNIVCFEDFHDTTPLSILNTYPPMDMVSSISYIQFASFNSSSIVGDLV